MTFSQAIATCFSKFLDVQGRAAKSEYWWFYLFTVLVGWGAMLIDPTQILASIVNVALLIPVVTAGTRRLHDVNRSGWWQLLVISLIGLIPLLYWTCSKGDEQANRFGAPPSGTVGSAVL